MLQVTPIPAFNDNYIWLINITKSNRYYVVDPGCSDSVINYLSQQQIQLDGILITHHHQDHTGGIAKLQAYSATELPVYGPSSEKISGITEPIDVNTTQIDLGEDLKVQVMHLPGHTLGHIAYKLANHVFCGDTLFSGGCGRLFEGTAAQMHASLSQLAGLAGDTLFYPAHEYTLSNLAFAVQVDPSNQALQRFQARCQQLRQQQRPTLPTSLPDQLAINPFLRCDDDKIQASLSQHFQTEISDPVQAFALLRQWKDTA
ncbi:hydroxyacylglutathione hydrolase [Shewanella waksmanii]|uniref:hydroxyacylglutathione hydrolase n=1 Tax=Shewanella waksmanii TaxID=213783 RepID=UPI003735EEC4